jgi:TfoX/Sxy family transcriptional regulator of competence genes
MAFDQILAERIRAQLGQRPGLVEKKMFGGVGFLLKGNMCCGVNGQDLIVRIDPQQTEEALSQPHTRIFDMTGRPMKGWIVVQPEGLKNDADLMRWIDEGVRYASTLPAK